MRVRFRQPFLLARTVAHWPVLALVLLITFGTGALAASFAAYDTQALRHAAELRLAGADTSITVQSAAASTAVYESSYDSVRSDAGQNLGALPYTLTGSLWSAQLLYASTPTSSGVVRKYMVATSSANLAAHATVTAGAWPTAPATAAGRARGVVPAAIPASLAARLNLSVGSELHLGARLDSSGDVVQSADLEITGLYRIDSSADPYWRLSPTGAADTVAYGGSITYGPLAVDATAFSGKALPTAQDAFLLQVPLNALIAADPTTASDSVTGLVSVLGDDQTLLGEDTHSTLQNVLQSVAAARAAADSTLLIVILELVGLSVIALAVTARPLAARRDAERALLTQRGRSAAQYIGADLREAAAIGVIGLLTAVPAGLWLARTLGRHTDPGWDADVRGLSAAGPAWLAAGSVAVLCAGTAFAAGGRRRPPRDLRPRSTRQARLAAAGRAQIDLLFVVLFGLAYWQLRSFGLLTAGSGGTRLNAAGALTPALGLCAGSLLALRIPPLLGAIGDRSSERGRGFAAAHVFWQYNRYPRRNTGPALLVVLAVATATLCLSEHLTWRDSVADQSAYSVGADVRVSLEDADAGNGGYPGIAGLPGVRAATAVIRTGGDGTSTLLAVDSTTAPRTLAANVTGDWPRLDAGGGSIALPGDPARIAVTVAADAGLASLHGSTLTIEVQDAHGITYRSPALALEPTATPQTLTYQRADFVAAARPATALRLVGIALDYPVPIADEPTHAHLSVQGLAVSDSAAANAPETPVSDQEFGGWTAYADSPQIDVLSSLAQAEGLNPPGTATASAAVTGSAAAGWSASLDSGYLSAAGERAALGTGALSPPLSGFLTLGPYAHDAPLPALATASYLTAHQLGVGDTVAVDFAGAKVQARIVGSVAEFPTLTAGEGGLVVDLGRLEDEIAAEGSTVPLVGEWWLSTAAGAVPAGLPASAEVADLASIRAGMLNDPFSVGAQEALAALGIAAGVLAAAALAAAIGANRRERSAQEAVLAALGVSVRRQTMLQCWERLAVCGPAAILGLGLGIGLTALVLPYLTLASDATLPTPSARIVVDWGGSGLLALLVVGLPLLALLPAALARPDAASRLRLLEDS